MVKKYNYDQLSDMYNSGMSYAAISKEVGISIQALVRIAKQGHITARTLSEAQRLNPTTTPKHDYKHLQRLYDNGLSLRDVSRVTKINIGTLEGAVKRGLLLTRTRSQAYQISRPKHLGRKHTLAAREKMREKILERYATGWMPKAGKCKKIRYSSTIAGNITVDGTWELLFAQFCDRLNLNWIRNKERFPYIHLNGKESHYTPDFYLPDIDCFVEIKGYERDLDRCKWKQFNRQLIVFKKKQILIIKTIVEGWQSLVIASGC